ncbi:MAG: hypothetical protein JSV70_03025, partial [bacterium]
DDLVYLYDFLFIGSVRHQILPLRRYYELYDRWERRLDKTRMESIFTPQEMLDLQVLFLLAWTGTVIREEEPLVRQLLEKGRNYQETEKFDLVQLLLRRVAGIIPAYREALQSGSIEITTSPYYHPILPLIYDFTSARAVERHLPLPVGCSPLSEDARVHMEKALDRFQEAFGVRCKGVWPSEGAVSPEALEEMIRLGVAYVSSDEEVLAHSLDVSLPGMGGRREELYSPWTFPSGEGAVGIFFRDRPLSDAIGFTYQRMEAGKAVRHFITRLHEIRRSLNHENGIVTVILDGENAWEHYPSNGRPFLEGLYEALAADPAITMVTMSQALESVKPLVLPRLVPGSWIGGRLSTWVGHPEKNRAWELVCRTRQRLQGILQSLDEERRENVVEQLLVAEGSDWYWWYGDDHFTTLADRFDELFRLHLINACRFADIEVPPELLEPILRKRARGHLREPLDTIHPTIDGRESNYFEWINAGIFNLDFDQGSMHLTDPVFRDLYYGFDEEFLYLRLDTEGHFLERSAGCALVVEVIEPVKQVFRFDIEGETLSLSGEEERGEGVRGAMSRLAEIAMPLASIEATPGKEILLSFGLWRGADPVEKAPLFSLVKIKVPEDYELEYWIV